MIEIARHIQYTNVNPEMTREQLIDHCELAAEYGFDAAMIAPCWASLATEILRGTPTHVASCFAFPNGNDSTSMKVAALKELSKIGVKDVDFTSQSSYLLSGMVDEYLQDLKDIAYVARQEGVQTKVIIEFGLLSAEQRLMAAKMAVEAQIDYLKQSSGFLKGIAATPQDISLLKSVTKGSSSRVKASGKINSYRKACGLLEAGASLLGTSSAIAIITGGEDVSDRSY